MEKAHFRRMTLAASRTKELGFIGRTYPRNSSKKNETRNLIYPSLYIGMLYIGMLPWDTTASSTQPAAGQTSGPVFLLSQAPLSLPAAAASKLL